MGRKGSSQFARPRRSSRREQHLGPPEPSEDLLPVCLRLALCASLLLEPGLAHGSHNPRPGSWQSQVHGQPVSMTLGQQIVACPPVRLSPAGKLQGLLLLLLRASHASQSSATGQLLGLVATWAACTGLRLMATGCPCTCDCHEPGLGLGCCWHHLTRR